jgi:undecaprenyl-diphosphatase
VTILDSIILGIVQGLTEFLPVSSDGHLAITYKLLGLKPDLSFEVFLHAATLIAIFWYFRHDVIELATSLLPKHAERKADRRLVLFIVLATAISAVIALALGPFLESLSSNMVAVAAGFFLTTILLVIAEALTHGAARVASPDKLKPVSVALIAVLQGLAALPGVSRSGSTIAGSMMAGLRRDQAARLSFLLGIPIITLAALKDGLDIVQGSSSLPGTVPALILGFLAAGIGGYLAIWGLLRFVKNHPLYWFAAYTGVLGTVILVLSSTLGRG